MKKKDSKVSVIIMIVFAGLTLCLAGGNLYMGQSLKVQEQEKNRLIEEKAALEAVIQEGEIIQAGLQDELDQAMTQAEAAEEKEEKNQEGREDGEYAGEETPPVELESVKDVIASRTADLINAGEKWQVYAYRFSDKAQALSGSGKMTAASLIKLYIMGAAYSSYDTLISQNGQDTVDSLIESMITASDNEAANNLTKMLGQGDEAAGRKAVNTYCALNGYGDTSMGRMLLETGTDRENYTSAQDCGKFLKKVYSQELPHAQEMLSLLKHQERTGKIPAGVPDSVETANKTGELEHVENDAAIVFAQENPYVLCVMSENVENTSEARQNITNISADVYTCMVQQE